MSLVCVIYRNSNKSKEMPHIYTPCIFMSISLWLLSASVVQLGTTIMVFISANKDIILYGNFL